MKTRIQNDPYRIVNLVFAISIIAIIFYSLIFTPDQHHPVPSGSLVITGKPSISTGLSRSFSAITRFEFDRAAAFNPYGLRIFIFFIIQLFMRVAGLILAGHREKKAIVLTDVILSVILFTVLFWPFFVALVQSLNSN